MQYKNHINSLTRLQTSLSRDIENGTLLDRNERVDYFNTKTFKKIISNNDLNLKYFLPKLQIYQL